MTGHRKQMSFRLNDIKHLRVTDAHHHDQGKTAEPRENNSDTAQERQESRLLSADELIIDVDSPRREDGDAGENEGTAGSVNSPKPDQENDGKIDYLSPPDSYCDLDEVDSDASSNAIDDVSGSDVDDDGGVDVCGSGMEVEDEHFIHIWSRSVFYPFAQIEREEVPDELVLWKVNCCLLSNGKRNGCHVISSCLSNFQTNFDLS